MSEYESRIRSWIVDLHFQIIHSNSTIQSPCMPSFNNLWYTDAQAYKFNNDLSATGRFCRSGKSETIAHIIACPSRAQAHDKYRPRITAHFRDCRIGDNLLKALEQGIEVVCPIQSHTEEKIGEATQKGPR